MIDVSVIIPVYNVENHLKACLESVLAQNVSLEAICVDDGSTDGSLEVLKSLAERDSRVRVFEQEHKGPGAARNRGIEEARGQYLTFLDADDVFISGVGLEVAYDRAVKFNADFLVAVSQAVNSDGEIVSDFKYVNEVLLPSSDSFAPKDVADYLFQILPGVPWGRLYRRGMIVDEGIRFPELPMSEDFPFVRLAMVSAKRLSYSPEPLVSHAIGRHGSLQYNADSMPLVFIESNDYLYEELKRRGKWKLYANTARIQSAWLIYWNFIRQKNEATGRAIFDAFPDYEKRFETEGLPSTIERLPLHVRVNEILSHLRERTIHLAFITDDGFALPTGVAISSVKRHRDPKMRYCVHVIVSDVDVGSINRIKSLAEDDFAIDVIDVTGQADYTDFEIKGRPITPTAVLKFRLPELLPDLSRVLYLDGDVIVRKDLTEFWLTDITRKYIAAVSGRGAFYYKGLTLQERIGYQFEDYFNSGVMLLNLALMREDGIVDRLFDYRRTKRNDFMDQDALNVVLGEKAVFLPLKYNLTTITLRSCDVFHLNRWFPGMHVVSKRDAFERSVVFHYASPRKPWKFVGHEFAEEWEAEYRASPFSDVKLIRAVVPAVPDCPKPKISVIVPVKNVQKTIAAYLDKLLLQQEFSDLEVICVDDGSTDNTAFVVKARSATDSRLVLKSQPSLGRTEALYYGVKSARSEYVMFAEVTADPPDPAGFSKMLNDAPLCPADFGKASLARLYRKRDVIRLNYFNGWPNMGDAISPILVSRLSGMSVVHATIANGDISGLGSVLTRWNQLLNGGFEEDLDDPIHIWGSGFLKPFVREEGERCGRKLIVHAVRGVKTAETLRAIGLLAEDEEPVLGDPGVLCPNLVPGIREIPKTVDVALVPHRYDQEEYRSLEAALRNAGYTVALVDVMRDDPLSCLRKIASARKVLSSSLHGLVFADALGIPNRHVVSVGTEKKLRGGNTIDQFKFDDYYSAYGLDSPQATRAVELLADPRAVVEGITDADKVPAEKVADVCRSLLAAFPYPIVVDWQCLPEKLERRNADICLVKDDQRASHIVDSPKLSVIIPVFNAELYLHECMESVLTQDAFVDLEVICVNDGSTDSSYAILSYWARMDCRVKVLTQANLGPGAARNAGLAVAKGEYIVFLDADDRLTSGDNLKAAFDHAVANQLDVEVLASNNGPDADGNWTDNRQLRRELVPDKIVFAPKDVGVNLFQFVVQVPWAKLYRREFVIANNLAFPALRRSEDFPFVMSALLLSGRIGVLDVSLCDHRIGVVTSLESTKDETPCVFIDASKWFCKSINLSRRAEWVRLAFRISQVIRFAYNFQAVQKYSNFVKIVNRLCDEYGDLFEFVNICQSPRYVSAYNLIRDVKDVRGNVDELIELFVKFREKRHADLYKSQQGKLKCAVEKSRELERAYASCADAMRQRDEALKAKVAKQDERIAELKAQLEASWAKTRQVAEWLSESKSASAKRDERIAELKSKLEASWAKTRQVTEWLSESKSAGAKRDERIAELKSQLEASWEKTRQMTEWLSESKSASAKRDERIAELKSQLEASWAKTRQVTEWLSRSKAYAESLEKKVRTIRTMIVETDHETV